MSLFITFEGGEGSGKTTIIQMLEKELNNLGKKCIVTREPGGIDIAEQIRNVILNVNNTKMDSRTEALLYAAARVQHLVEKILPALANDEIVLCDRYIDSSLVYQGLGRGLGIKNIESINMFACEHMPNLTIFLDCPPEVGFQRIKENNREVNRLDLEKKDFHNMVYNGYKQISKMYPERIITVDATKTLDEVFNSVLKLVTERL